MRPFAAALLAALAPLTALAADDEPEKRAEGRYFVEAAEIMVRANDFDMLLGTLSNGGEVTEVSGELSEWNLDQPKILFGLNRPGKTSIVVGVHDFELKDERIPKTFDDAGEQIVTSPLIPPGIVFQRQRPGPNEFITDDDEYVPNWGEEMGFIHRVDYRSMDFTIHRTFFENKRFRARLLAGLRYSQLEQKTSQRVAFAEEGGFNNNGVRDFFNVQVATSTHGLGPQLGLNGRILAGKDSKWSFEAQGALAFLPESTNASYLLSMIDSSRELLCVDLNPDPAISDVRCEWNYELPVIPGIPTRQPGESFNALVRQTDFTEATWLFEGTVGVRYQISRGISIGVEGWHLRWMNLLSPAGLIDQVHEEATYELIEGIASPDPQLRDTEAVIHVPRFDRRKDVSFDGVSLNLRFEF